MITALSDTSALTWICIVGGSWLILACLATGAWSLTASRLKRQPIGPRRIPVYPPLIAATREPWQPTQADLDSVWASVSEVIDEEAAMNREFVSLIQTAWEWDERSDAA